jgi:hypothetical protein
LGALYIDWKEVSSNDTREPLNTGLADSTSNPNPIFILDGRIHTKVGT